MACSIGAGVSWQATLRPVLVRTISPASDSTSRCFMMAGRETGNGLASSLTVSAGSLSRRARMARRVGSARAAKVRSSVAGK
jgi:hypothetical protein